MHADRLAALSRVVSTAPTRRAALRGLVGTLIAGALRQRSSADAAADHGCRHAGATCTAPGQCCTGICLKGGVCSCNAQNLCPLAKNPCKKAVCSATGRCVYENRSRGRGCPDDGNPCTRDICDGQGNCIHLKQPNGTACGIDLVCFDRVCCTQGDSTCCPTCNGVCCPRADDICTPNDLQCCPRENVCFKSCCADGERCSNEDVCCASGNSCNGVCCPRSDDFCTPSDNTCCRPERVCHKSCCARDEFCKDGFLCAPIVIGS